ncbi:hypothetical protein D9M72_475320 [compost metagenome]
MVGHRAGSLLGRRARLFRRALRHARNAGAGPPHHAGRALVRGCHAELRAAGIPPRRYGQRPPARRNPPCRRGAAAGRCQLGHAASAGGVFGACAAPDGRAARRPRCRLPAQYPRHHRRLPGHGQPGRGLVGLRAGHGPGGGDRPLPPDRAQGADRSRRLPLWRQGLRPRPGACRPGRRPALADRPGAGAADRQPCGTACRRARACLAGGAGARRAADDRAGAVRPSALDRLFVRHHRHAQADRAWPWRHRHRAAQADGLP